MKEGILVTGATSDIAYEFLKNYKDKNKVIVAFYYDYEERLDDLIKNYNLNIVKVKYNFLNLEGISEVLQNILKDIFISEVLHLSAPAVKQERFNKIEISQYNIDFSIQVLSIIEILKFIIPKMKKEKRGKIVFVLTSYIKGVPPKFCTSYVTSKYALEGLMKSLVAEYSSFNIQINGISPSMIKSKFINNMDERLIEMEIDKHPMKRTIEIEEIVDTINYLFESNNKFLTGNNLLLTGGENF